MKIRNELEKELARRVYSDYVYYVHQGRWFKGKHLLLICEDIDLLINNELYNDKGESVQILIIEMPPQHGKSNTVTETLPSYYLGKFPNKRVIEVSYGDDLARRFGRRNKQKILEFGKEVFNIELSKGSSSDTDFEIDTHKGSMISRGIMAGITGQPADLIIIDDPIKNRQEADSETYRERMKDEFLNSILTRMSANGKLILIQTRWHEDDLAGWIKSNFKRVKTISLPCEAEENDILGRKVGDALFPEIGKDNNWLKEFKESYTTQEGTRAWLALFQQRPTNSDGNMIKRNWWKRYRTPPSEFSEIIQSWDCTFKDSDGSDYVVGQVWGKVGADCYLLDMVRARMDLPTTIQSIIDMSNKWPKAFLKLVEDKANGPAVIQILRNRIGGLLAINPEGGKIARASAVSPAIEAGNVYIPEEADWVYDFIEECSAFPNGKHDDMVDSMTQALNRLIYFDGSLPEKPKPKLPWFFQSPNNNKEGDFIKW